MLLSVTTARADAEERYPAVWLNPGFLSYHFERDRDLREDNVGIGAETELGREHALMAGTFINSDRNRSHYVGYQWRPLHWTVVGADVSAGLIAAALDGYPRMRNGGWYVAPLPFVGVQGERFGVNVTVIPTIKDRLNGAIALQFKIRIR